MTLLRKKKDEKQAEEQRQIDEKQAEEQRRRENNEMIKKMFGDLKISAASKTQMEDEFTKIFLKMECQSENRTEKIMEN